MRVTFLNRILSRLRVTSPVGAKLRRVGLVRLSKGNGANLRFGGANLRHLVFFGITSALLLSFCLPLQTLRASAEPAGEDGSSFCIIFVNADDPFGKEWSNRTGTPIQNWPDHHRRLLGNLFARIQQRSPGLLYRACNGGNLRLILDSNSRGTISMITHPNCIECTADILKDGELCECLVHELIHYLDTRGSISSTRKWNQLVAGRMQDFRAKYDFFGDVFYQAVDPRANEFKLPSCYSALGSGEALAEYTTAMVMSDWQPPPEIRAFIEQHVLSMPNGVDPERRLLQQSYANTLAQRYNETIALDTDVLKLNPSSLPARLELASLWLLMDEPEIALAHVSEALLIARTNQLTDFEPIAIQARQLYGNARIELALRQLKSHDYTSALNNCTKAIEQNPESLWLTERSGGSIINGQQLKSTVAVYHATRGMVLTELHEQAAALADFKKALALDTACSSAYAGAAVILHQTGRNQQALCSIEKAIALNANNSQYFETRAAVFAGLHNYYRAIDDCTRAIALNPGAARYYKTRASYYAAVNLTKLADQDRRKFQSLMAKPSTRS